MFMVKTMTSFHYLRAFVNERLTVAAEEIVTFFEKTIFDYEKEINRQRALLAAVCRPHINLQHTEVPEQFFGVNELQARVHKRNWGLNSQNLMKEEHVDLWTSLDKETNLETDSIFLTVKPDKSSDETFSTNPVKATEESVDSISDAELKDSHLPGTDQAVIKPENLELTKTGRRTRVKRTACYLHAELAPSRLKEEAVLDDQQLLDLQKSSSLGHSDSPSPQIKEEQQDLCISQHEDPLELTQDPDALVSSLSRGNSYHNGAETLDLHPSELQSSGKSFHESGYRADGPKTPAPALEAEKHDYKCETCGKGFQFRSRLLRHMIIHTGVKPFSCHVCGKGFNQKSILIVHLRIHTGERPYSCDVCGKRFNQTSILNVHKRIHTGERPYCCETCGKRFTQKSILNGHKTIHTGERPFSCKACGKSLRSHSSLSVHMKTRH